MNVNNNDDNTYYHDAALKKPFGGNTSAITRHPNLKWRPGRPSLGNNP